MSSAELRPFLKWAGGKRWLVEGGMLSLPRIQGRYIEPFVGGGALFFALRPKVAVLSDANARLIELYQAIKDDHTGFLEILKVHASRHSRDYYYQVRGLTYNDPISRAAQFLYLNRTCWNGLYRENLRGEFNVPIGTKTTVIFATDDFGAWSNALQGAELYCRDFEASINGAENGDFLFVDPPYTVRHNMNGFVKYNQKIFSWSDQVRLREALGRAVQRGVGMIVTNADHESVRELYDGFGEHRSLGRHSVIAGSARNRGYSTELIIVA